MGDWFYTLKKLHYKIFFFFFKLKKKTLKQQQVVVAVVDGMIDHLH